MGLDVNQDVKSKAPLASEAFVTLGIPIATSNALIYGKRDAVLVGVDGIASISSHYFGTVVDSTIVEVILPSIGREVSLSIFPFVPFCIQYLTLYSHSY